MWAVGRSSPMSMSLVSVDVSAKGNTCSSEWAFESVATELNVTTRRYS